MFVGEQVAEWDRPGSLHSHRREVACLRHRFVEDQLEDSDRKQQSECDTSTRREIHRIEPERQPRHRRQHAYAYDIVF